MSASVTDVSFRDLGTSLDDAVGNGYLGETSPTTTEAVIKTKARTAFRYLFLLGYLDRLPPDDLSADGKKGAKWREQIRFAIRNFQTDCGLAINGDLNDDVWQALLQLSSFDNPTYVNRWFRNGKPLPAIRRAVQMRLYAFGLSKRLPKPSVGIHAKDKEQEANLTEGLSSFVRAAKLLNLSDQPLEPKLTLSTLNVLFEQSELIKRLALGGKSIHVYHPVKHSSRRRKMNREFAIEFVQNIARVELWLFGYSVRIGSGKDKDRIQSDIASQSLSAALKEFMDVHANEPAFADIGKGTIPGLFFGRLLELRLQSDDPEDVADADIIVNQVLEDKNIASQVRGGIKNFGARLWDGIQRVWRWFKSGIIKLFDKAKRIVKSVISNITRFVHSSAIKVFARVKATIRAVKDGFNLLKEKVLRGSDPKHMVITHEKDFDFDVFINKNADPEFVTNLSERLSTRSRIFLIAGKIVSELLSLFIAVIHSGIATGWFGLLLALVKLRKALKSLKRFAKEEIILMSQLDELRGENQ